MILESKPNWSLIDGKLGVAPPQGAAARAIYFLQQHKPELHPCEPLPIESNGKGFVAHIEKTSRLTFVTIWHGFYCDRVSGGVLDSERPQLEFFDVENVRGVHVHQMVPAKEGVAYDGLISFMKPDHSPISIGGISLKLFEPRLVWTKRLKLYKERDECDECDEY